MTQSKYSLAAKLSRTLFTSLVKLPSTCLLLIGPFMLSSADLGTAHKITHVSVVPNTILPHTILPHTILPHTILAHPKLLHKILPHSILLYPITNHAGFNF